MQSTSTFGSANTHDDGYIDDDDGYDNDYGATGLALANDPTTDYTRLHRAASSEDVFDSHRKQKREKNVREGNYNRVTLGGSSGGSLDEDLEDVAGGDGGYGHGSGEREDGQGDNGNLSVAADDWEYRDFVEEGKGGEGGEGGSGEGGERASYLAAVSVSSISGTPPRYTPVMKRRTAEEQQQQQQQQLQSQQNQRITSMPDSPPPSPPPLSIPPSPSENPAPFQ